ncbi:MAG TPA: energy transducer TonB [Niabella sp.]|nr:energy transducer TonB [Niabella sp.]
METTKILTASLLDIVFDGRNKSYGAYELRKNYQQRLTNAILITAGICIVIGGSAWLKNTFSKAEPAPLVKIYDNLVIENIKPVEEKLPEPLQPPPAPKIEVPKIKSIIFTTPVLTDKEVVTPPLTQDDLIHTKISNITQDGTNDIGVVVTPQSLEDGKGLIVSTRKEEIDYTQTFIKVEIDASYTGDWKRFLERNLSGEVPIDNGAAPGTYTVLIQFIVDTDGSISDIKPLTRHGYGMEQEAIRVIKKSGKWKPAIQNSREVKAYRKQPVTFQVMEQ